MAKKNAEMFPYAPSSPPAFQIQKLHPDRRNLEIKLNSTLTGVRIKYNARSSTTKRKEAKAYVIKAEKKTIKVILKKTIKNSKKQEISVCFTLLFYPYKI